MSVCVCKPTRNWRRVSQLGIKLSHQTFWYYFYLLRPNPLPWKVLHLVIMDVKFIVKDHPLALPSDISMAKIRAKAFAEEMQVEGEKDISSVKVTWTPYGKFGGMYY